MSNSRPARTRPLTVAELLVLLLVAWALWATSASAQLGPIKTAPIATGSPVRGSLPHACGVDTGGVTMLGNVRGLVRGNRHWRIGVSVTAL
jgi:hypothetical protein